MGRLGRGANWGGQIGGRGNGKDKCDKGGRVGGESVTMQITIGAPILRWHHRGEQRERRGMGKKTGGRGS